MPAAPSTQWLGNALNGNDSGASNFVRVVHAARADDLGRQERLFLRSDDAGRAYVCCANHHGQEDRSASDAPA
jgi:hypothetical protein